MGFFSWLNKRFSHPASQCEATKTAATPERAEVAPGCPMNEWDEVPPYLEADPREHLEACIIASAIAAGANAESKLVVKRVLAANPEHRRVAAIATALAAGALEKSSFTVKHIYKQKVTEENHAA